METVWGATSEVTVSNGLWWINDGVGSVSVMQRMDEKIIELMNRAYEQQEEIEPRDVFVPNTEEEGTWFVQIGDEQVLFEERSVLDGKAVIRIPRAFERMDAEMAERKYPNQNRPEIIFTNDTGTINVTMNHTVHAVKRIDMHEFKKVIMDVLKRSQPMARWMGDGMKEVNDRVFGYFSFVIPAWDTNLYNFMFCTYLDKKALLCTFNCTEREMDDWKTVALAIMESLHIESKE